MLELESNVGRSRVLFYCLISVIAINISVLIKKSLTLVEKRVDFDSPLPPQISRMLFPNIPRRVLWSG